MDFNYSELGMEAKMLQPLMAAKDPGPTGLSCLGVGRAPKGRGRGVIERWS